MKYSYFVTLGILGFLVVGCSRPNQSKEKDSAVDAFSRDTNPYANNNASPSATSTSNNTNTNSSNSTNVIPASNPAPTPTVIPVPPPGIFRVATNGGVSLYLSSGARFCYLDSQSFSIVAGVGTTPELYTLFASLPSPSFYDGACKLDPVPGTIPIYRGSNWEKYDQIYTHSPVEIDGVKYKPEDQFSIFAKEWYQAMEPVYRCYRPYDHWMSTNPDCNGLGISEGKLGYVSKIQLPNTVPLINFLSGNEHIVTPHSAMQTKLRLQGWSEIGIVGYVPAPNAILLPNQLLTLKERLPASGEVLYGLHPADQRQCTEWCHAPFAFRSVYTFPGRPEELTHFQLAQYSNSPSTTYSAFKFLIYKSGGADFAPVYRCSKRYDHVIYEFNAYWEIRFLSRASNCEGATNEGLMGYVFKNPVEGTVPLVRYYQPETSAGLHNAYYVTSSAALQQRFERDCIKKEMILGYVAPITADVRADEQEAFLNPKNNTAPKSIPIQNPNRTAYSTYLPQCR